MGNGEGEELPPSRSWDESQQKPGPPIKISSTVTASILMCNRAFPPVSLKKGHRVREKLDTPPNSWRDIALTEDNELSNYHWYSTHYAETYLR